MSNKTLLMLQQSLKLVPLYGSGDLYKLSNLQFSNPPHAYSKNKSSGFKGYDADTICQIPLKNRVLPMR